MPGRARNHEGTEWRDKANGRWRWRIRWEGEDHYVSDANRARAREKRDKLILDLRRGRRVSDAGQTLTAWLEYWLEADVRRDVSQSTFHDYRKRLELYIVPSIGHYTLAELQADTKIVRRWSNATRDGYALSSARQALALLKRALQLAFEEHILDFNPAASIVIPPAPRISDDEDDEEGKRALTADQERAFMLDVLSHDRYQVAHAPDKRFNQSAGMYLLYSLAFLLGLRRGELLGLRRKDIDLEQRILRVRQQVIRLDGEHRISKTLKTKTSKRDLPLPGDLVSLLRPHLLRLGAGRDALLFPATDGGPLRPDAVTKHFARTCKRVDITGFHMHDTRATAITRWRTQQVQAEVVAAMAGHESADISLEVYTAVTMERKRAALGG